MTNNNCVNNYSFNCSDNYNFNRYQILDDSKSPKDLLKDTDLSLTTVSENELDIEPKAPLRSSKVSAAGQEVVQNLKKLKVDQETTTENHTRRGFRLKHISAKSEITKMNDETAIAENFIGTRLNDSQIAQRHMWKRLNFFLVMSRYVHEKAPFLKDMNFPRYQKRQFKAEAYVMPKKYKATNGYERAHIGILNKIVVRQEGKLSTMRGKLELAIENIETKKIIRTSTLEFFNLCDIVPKLINTIDWYAEYHLRGRSCKLLSQVKNGSQTFTQASYQFACDYAECLIGLLDRILDKNNKPQKYSNLNKEFEFNTTTILKNKAIASKYIDGMLEAIIDFRTRYPSLNYLQNKDNLSTYPLYEKVS